MADLRELVARAILGSDLYGLWDGELDVHDPAFRKAEAVLAALREAGVLLPELPEGWHVARVQAFYDDDEVDEEILTGYAVLLKYPLRYGGRWLDGTGPTIPAAIANALEGLTDA